MLGLFIFLAVVTIMLLAAVVILVPKKLAQKDKFFTPLGPEQGKLIRREKNIVKVISNMTGGHFDNTGEWKDEPKPLGNLFQELGIVYFGIPPIEEVYKFSVQWSDFIEAESQAVKNGAREPFKVIEKHETIDHFKRFYSHAVVMLKVEMGSGIKIDLVLIVTFEVLNIIQLLFKVKPDGIVLAQAETAIMGAVQDELRGKEYEKFRDDEDKSNPESDFIKNIIKKTNDIIVKAFHLKVAVVELKDYDMSLGEPGDEEIEKAQTAVKLAEITGNAEIMKAEKRKAARLIDAEADALYFEKIGEKIGKENLGSFANLGQVQNSKLIVYNSPNTGTNIQFEKPKDEKNEVN